MFLLGTVINSLLIILGSLSGLFFRNIPIKMRETVLLIIGLAVAVLGIQMGITSTNFVIVIISLVIGTVIGEWLDIEKWFNQCGLWIESKFKQNVENEGKIAEGFVTASLIFVIGSMAVLGAIDSGLKNDHSILITKGIIDGFMAIILTSTLGVGVLLSAIPVFIYEGIIALCANFVSSALPEEMFNLFLGEMTATGGIMIVAIGLNVAGLTKIRVANLLPSIFVVACIFIIKGLFHF